MRISRIHAAVLFAGLLAIAGRPARAHAQEAVIQRTQMVPADRDAAQTARLDAVNQDMNDLFTAQRAYFRQHGRFAETFAELPDFSRGAASGIRMTAGDDWYVVLGGGTESGVLQQVVHITRPESTQVVQGAGAGEAPIVRTERVEGVMTRPR